MCDDNLWLDTTKKDGIASGMTLKAYLSGREQSDDTTLNLEFTNGQSRSFEVKPIDNGVKISIIGNFEFHEFIQFIKQLEVRQLEIQQKGDIE